jgi:hypothetical protein
MAYVAAAVLAGGNVRVGLEDNLWLGKGVLATNAQLVERATTIIEAMGARVITPAEVRAKLGLATNRARPAPAKTGTARRCARGANAQYGAGDTIHIGIRLESFGIRLEYLRNTSADPRRNASWHARQPSLAVVLSAAAGLRGFC